MLTLSEYQEKQQYNFLFQGHCGLIFMNVKILKQFLQKIWQNLSTFCILTSSWIPNTDLISKAFSMTVQTLNRILNRFKRCSVTQKSHNLLCSLTAWRAVDIWRRYRSTTFHFLSNWKRQDAIIFCGNRTCIHQYHCTLHNHDIDDIL